MTSDATLDLAVDFLRDRLGQFAPKVAVVLGSGLGRLADSVNVGSRIPYSEIPGFPSSTVVGHSGELVTGVVEDVPVVLQSGRFHLYEGHEGKTVVLPVRVFAELGVEYLVVTNAAGCLRPDMRPPTLMLIADHINMMWGSPLMGPVVDGEPRFPDLFDLYDKELRTLARRVALDLGVRLEEGVYLSLLGPCYETPAEVRMLQRLGADAVGMSTVPEVLVARARGLKVLGISSITNMGAGLFQGVLNHQEVLEAGEELAVDLERLVRGVLSMVGGRGR
ncbi:MAG: purine-nucleoside phosphorylase [Gemmatimonadales bacterium]